MVMWHDGSSAAVKPSAVATPRPEAMPFSQPLTRVRLRQRKKIGPGVAATANPRTNPLSSRLDTRTSHGPQILLMERRGPLEAVHRQAGGHPQHALAHVTDR